MSFFLTSRNIPTLRSPRFLKGVAYNARPSQFSRQEAAANSPKCSIQLSILIYDTINTDFLNAETNLKESALIVFDTFKLQLLPICVLFFRNKMIICTFVHFCDMAMSKYQRFYGNVQ